MICEYFICGDKTTAPFGYVHAKTQGRIPEDEPPEEYVSINELNYMVATLKREADIIEESNFDYWHSECETQPCDCEDFALTIKKQLKSSGYNGGNIVTTQDNNHAILFVQTRADYYIVDINEFLPVQIDKYDPRRILTGEENGVWYSLDTHGTVPYLPIILGSVLFAIVLGFGLSKFLSRKRD